MATDLKFTASDLGYMNCPTEAWLNARGIKFSGFMGRTVLSDMRKAQDERLNTCVSLRSLCDEFPKGKIIASNKRPSTLPFVVEGVNVVLSGQYNYLIELEDGGFALCAFKDSNPTKNINALTIQLNALAFIMKNHKNVKERVTITQLGIMVFDTNAFDRGENFYSYHPVELDLDNFENNVLVEAVNVVKVDDMPDYDDCDLCKFMKQVEPILKAQRELVAA
jgi:hypothetical protein